MDAETIVNLSSQVSEMKRLAATFSADAHFYYWQENEVTVRGDEVCAAVQRLEWALARIGGIASIPRTSDHFESAQNLKPAASQY